MGRLEKSEGLKRSWNQSLRLREAKELAREGQRAARERRLVPCESGRGESWKKSRQRGGLFWQGEGP